VNIVMSINQGRLSGGFRGVIRPRAPTLDRPRRSRDSASDQFGGEGFRRDWFAQRTWEDDGGRIDAGPRIHRFGTAAMPSLGGREF
jgi:hypothetical protein